MDYTTGCPGHNRIAVLGAEVNEAYQAELWKGLSDEARRHSKQLICFLGSRVGALSAASDNSNPVYRLAHSGNFDGVIVISSVVSTYLNPKQVQSLFDVRPGIPRISIGLQIPGVGSVCVDGSAAMKEVAEHLIIEHGRKNFALIAGPSIHPESQQRRKTVLEVLQSHGIRIPPELQIFGGFVKSSGRESMRILLETGREIDAVICLNDQMAIGAIEELSAANISVPDMVSVCGFDGIEESAFCSPPLTTVRQPLYQVGVTAVRELYRLMEGEAPRDVRLTCFPVFRQSCSCRPVVSEASPGRRAPADSPGVREGQASEASEYSSDTVNISLESLFNENRPEAFITGFEKSVNSSLFGAADYFKLDRELYRIESGLPEASKEWFNVLSNARRLLWETRTRTLINDRILKKQRSDLLRGVGTSLTGAFELPELFNHLAAGLLELGFNHGYLVIYSDTKEGDLPEFRLVFKIRDGKFFPDISIPFSNDEFLPSGSKQLCNEDCTSWMFSPLVFQERAIGHMLLPGSHPDTEIYDTLSRQIASSLQGAVLLEQVRSHEMSLVDEVRRRTQELTRVNTELQQEVEKRTRLEQEIIDISKHTMEQIGQDLHDDLCQHLAGISLQVSALGRRLENSSPEAVKMTDLINCQLNDSIARTKRIIRGMLPLGFEEEGISDAIDSLCTEMSVYSGLEVEYRRDERINILETGRAVELYRIVQEAVNNSIRHSAAAKICVEVTTADYGRALRFSVVISDNGGGFTDCGNSKGMGLKIMRYRGERAGMEVTVDSNDYGVRVVCSGTEEYSDGKEVPDS